jgi:hypothetical protein
MGRFRRVLSPFSNGARLAQGSRHVSGTDVEFGCCTLTYCQLVRDAVACGVLVVVRLNAMGEGVREVMAAQPASTPLLRRLAALVQPPLWAPVVGHLVCVGCTACMALLATRAASARLLSMRKGSSPSCAYTRHRRALWLAQMCLVALLQQLCLYVMHHAAVPNAAGATTACTATTALAGMGQPPLPLTTLVELTDNLRVEEPFLACPSVHTGIPSSPSPRSHTPEYLSHPLLSMFVMSITWPLLNLSLGAYKSIVLVRLLLTVIMVRR